MEQECIPVGCVPPAHWPYLVVSATHATPATHTPLPHMPPSAMHAPPATHAPHHAHPLPCHACPPQCTPPCHAQPPFHTCPPAMPAPCHVCPPAMHAPLPHMPPHPVDRILETHFWKYYLALISLQAVMKEFGPGGHVPGAPLGSANGPNTCGPCPVVSNEKENPARYHFHK